VHTPSSVDIDLGTLLSVHGEPKLPHRFGESTRVFIRRTSTIPVPIYFAIPIFESQTGKNISALPSSDITIDSDRVSDDLITLRNILTVLIVEIFFGAFVSVIYFGILALNILLRWGWKRIRPMRLGR